MTTCALGLPISFPLTTTFEVTVSQEDEGHTGVTSFAGAWRPWRTLDFRSCSPPPRVARGGGSVLPSVPWLGLAPLVGGNYKWNRVERPRTVAPLRIGIHVICDAVFNNEPTRQLGAPARGLRPLSC